MKRSMIWNSMALLILGTAGILVMACSAQTAAIPQPTPSVPAVPMSVANSPARVLPATVHATGNLLSASQATLAFQAAGRVKEINLKEGDRVKAGTVIASLDTSTLDAQVAQAQALVTVAQSVRDNPQQLDLQIAQAQTQVHAAKYQADAARANATSAETLKDAMGGVAIAPQQKVVMNQWYAAQSQLAAAQATFDGAQNVLQVLVDTRANPAIQNAQIDAARAALELAKQSIANAKIIAPFDGTILSIVPNVGESVAPGTPAVTIADLSHMQVKANVDEISVASIQVGQTATITADALPGKIFTGKVTKIGLLATTTTGVVRLPVTMDVDSSDPLLVPGLSTTVEIKIGQ